MSDAERFSWKRVVRFVGDHLVSTVLTLLIMAGLTAGLAAVRGDASDSQREPDGRNCPADFSVKGNISQSGERIYHLPGWRYYDATYPNLCFADEESAADAGYRASKVK